MGFRMCRKNEGGRTVDFFTVFRAWNEAKHQTLTLSRAAQIVVKTVFRAWNLP